MKNSARIRVHEPDQTVILVELFGEFDLGTRRALRTTVGSVARRGRTVIVDLSGVTFLDSACLRELAVQHKLHANHLALRDPSYEVELSVAVCDFEGWIDFHPSTDLTSRPRTRRSARHTPDEESHAAGRTEGGKRLPDRPQVRERGAPGAPFRRRGPQEGRAAPEDHRR